jgi:hypothetical protein
MTVLVLLFDAARRHHVCDQTIGAWPWQTNVLREAAIRLADRMHVREELEVVADDEEMQQALVRFLKLADGRTAPRIAHEQTDQRIATGNRRARDHFDVKVIRVGSGSGCGNERHAAARTPVAFRTPHIGVHRAPVFSRR